MLNLFYFICGVVQNIFFVSIFGFMLFVCFWLKIKLIYHFIYIFMYIWYLFELFI